MPRALEAVIGTVLPARLGASFRWLWSASTLTNIGDGIVLAAGPLLVASQTRDPFVLSLPFFGEFLPSLVFGTFAGVGVDRADRRRILILVNLARATTTPANVPNTSDGRNSQKNASDTTNG